MVVALFVGLIIAAILGPIVKLFRKVMPQALAVALGIVTLLAVLAAIVAFIATSVSGQWESLAAQFGDGVGDIQRWLEGPPFNIQSGDFSVWFDNARQWVLDNRGNLAAGVVGSAGRVLEIVAVLALAVFSAVCFLGGEPESGIGRFGYCHSQLGHELTVPDTLRGAASPGTPAELSSSRHVTRSSSAFCCLS